MAAVKTPDNPQYDPIALWRGQDYQVSARLHIQNWIWEHSLDYVLHPTIDIRKDKAIRVADVACNNGAWILDLARQRPNATFDGFDISPNNFVASGWQPPNCNFHVWDASSEVPAEFIGVYDVVHIRAFYAIIVESQTEPYLSSLLKMLKPGGYLQWDEGDQPTMTCPAPPGSNVSNKATSTIIDFFHNNVIFVGNRRTTRDWLFSFPTTRESKGCTVLAEERIKARTEFQRAWCDNFLLLFATMVPQMPEAPGRETGVFSRQESQDLVLESVEECQNGVWINHDLVIFVARKAE